jgi:hypothetical protein
MSHNDTQSDAKSGRRTHAPSPFKVVSVEKTDAPQGGSDDTWYSYVLDNGRSKITGKYCGSLKSVTAYANQYAAGINARAGSGHSAWAPRAKKPAAPSA